MKKKISKAVTVFLCLMTIIVNGYNFLKGSFVNFMSLSALLPVISTLYNNVDAFFLLWNRNISYLENRTISFEPKVKFKILEDNYTLEDIIKIVNAFLKKNNYSVKQNGMKINTGNFELKINSKNQLFSTISAYVDNDELYCNLTLQWNFQLAFRDLKNNWKEFKELREDVIRALSCNLVINSVSIKTSEYKKSLFYKVTIKKFDDLVVNSANLKVQNERITIDINKNELYAYSEKIDEIEDVVKNFIPLTNVF